MPPVVILIAGVAVFVGLCSFFPVFAVAALHELYRRLKPNAVGRFRRVDDDLLIEAFARYASTKFGKAHRMLFVGICLVFVLLAVAQIIIIAIRVN